MISVVKSSWRSVQFCLNVSLNASKKLTIVRIILEMVLPLLPIATAFVSSCVINVISSKEKNSADNLIPLLFLALGLVIINSVFRSLQEITKREHSELIQNEISISQMRRALSMDLLFFDKPENYDRLISSMTDSMVLSEQIWVIMSLFSSTISLITTLVIIVTFNAWYGIVILVISIPTGIASIIYAKKNYKLSLKQVKDGRKLSQLQSISLNRAFAQDIRLFNVQDNFITRYKKLWANLFSARKFLNRKQNFVTNSLSLLPQVVILFIAYIQAINVMQGSVAVGDFTLTIELSQQLSMGVISFISALAMIYENRLRFNNLQEFQNVRNNITDGIIELNEPIHSIEFVNVSFRYSDEEPYVLQNISLRFDLNETVAIVGKNGSGKSSLIKLLLRMYDPTAGLITVNGIDIKDYTVKSIRKQFSVYFQNMQNFPFNLRDNFLLSNNNYNEYENLFDKDNINQQVDNREMSASNRILRYESKMYEMLCKSSSQDILKRSPKGFDQPITKMFESDGLELSTGQSQKLALARTFYREYSVLILDEPTSSVDAEAEQTIRNTVHHLSNGKITLVVTQKLYNLNVANRIVLIESGKIVEQGSHEELIKLGGKYATMILLQNEK